uniref:Cation transporter n=1 Tax=candidate division WOR-3 bacterium TaxID=2052148 RepID=A0A7C1NAW1_UNCW3
MAVHEHSRRQGRSLLLSILLNLGFALLELFAGLFANSLVLVAGALHDAGDAVALVLSWLGLRLSLLPPNRRRTFGYRKVRILVAFVNALALAVFTVLVVRAAIGRIVTPEPVKSPVLILAALVGIGVNGAAVLILRQERHSLNIRAAMWHLLDDLLGFVAVLLGGIVIRLTGWTVIDPVLSIAVGIMVLYGTWRVFREATSILIDSTPRDLNYEEVRRFITSFSPAIRDLHDLHIWTLGEGERALMAHLVVADGTVSSFQSLLAQLDCALRDRFNIQHITFELECDACKSGAGVCLN